MKVCAAWLEPDGALTAFVILSVAGSGGGGGGGALPPSPETTTFETWWLSSTQPVAPVKPSSTFGGSASACERYCVPSIETLRTPASRSTTTWRTAVRRFGIAVEVGEPGEPIDRAVRAVRDPDEVGRRVDRASVRVERDRDPGDAAVAERAAAGAERGRSRGRGVREHERLAVGAARPAAADRHVERDAQMAARSRAASHEEARAGDRSREPGQLQHAGARERRDAVERPRRRGGRRDAADAAEGDLVQAGRVVAVDRPDAGERAGRVRGERDALGQRLARRDRRALGERRRRRERAARRRLGLRDRDGHAAGVDDREAPRRCWSRP